MQVIGLSGFSRVGQLGFSALPSSSQSRVQPMGVDAVTFSGRKTKVPQLKHYIGGQFVEGSDSKRFKVLNPHDRTVLAMAPNATAAEVDTAVQAARKAFPVWSKTSPQERAAVLNKIADVILAHKEELALLETKNQGKSLKEATFDIEDSARHFQYYAQQILNQRFEQRTLPDGQTIATLTKEPVGVVGQIIPWNYPLMMAAWKLAPALAAGCTSVIKPAEQTPLSLLKLAEYLQETGLPDGAINIVTGQGDPTGKALVNHSGIDKYSFTGSSAVGRGIKKAVAERGKDVILELGGKSPNIVFADADFEAAVDGALFGIMVNQGEVCSAGSRILVQRDIYDQFVTRLAEKAQNIRLGSGLDADNNMGPLVSREQKRRVMSYIKLGLKEGARAIVGGAEPTDPALKKGNYVQPTIFVDVDPKSRIAQEEIFGPVAVVIPFDTEEEALKIANGVDFDLAAAIWTQDLERAKRVAQDVQAGIVWINNSQPAAAEIPWGGLRLSGSDHDTLESYQVTKTITSGSPRFEPWFTPLAPKA